MIEYPPVKTGKIPLLFRALKDPASHARYDGDHASVQVLPIGFKRRPECRAFNVRTVYEKDVKIPMRDGIILRGDIFRPEGPELLPAILPWSPYGKSGRGKLEISSVRSRLIMLGIRLTDMPGNMGIPYDRLSGFEKFEGPDPAEWTARGYAVVNVDSRGSWDSQGYLWYSSSTCVRRD